MENQLRDDLKQALLMTNELVVATIRLVISELKNAQITKGEPLTHDESLVVIQKELKKRREAALAFRNGNREELAVREEAEAAVLERYLPEQMPEDELRQIITDSIKELGASSIRDMGNVIGAVRARVGQKAEGGLISKLVKEQLSV